MYLWNLVPGTEKVRKFDVVWKVVRVRYCDSGDNMHRYKSVY